MSTTHPTLRCSLGHTATLATGRDIYPRRKDLAALKFWECKPCGAYVGCHAKGDFVPGPDGQRIYSDGTLPKGTLADSLTRAARRAAHQALDPRWDGSANPEQARLETYAWLAAQLGIPVHECHIGMFDREQCAAAIRACSGQPIHPPATTERIGMNDATTPTTPSSAPDALLFYDTETTGLPLWSEPSEDPRQPRMVQLAACLIQPVTQEILASFDVIIRPDGWEIPDDVAKIHGITTEMAHDLGVSESMAVGMLIEFWREHEPRLRVGYNESFDARIIRIALMRHEDPGLADFWKEAPASCAAMMATSHVKAPPTQKMINAGRNHPKKPTLAEAYRHFMGRELEAAHTAMGDVLGCADVYFAALRASAPTT